MKLRTILFLLVVTVVSRAVWHPFGATATLAAGFITAYFVDKRASLILMFMGLLISDAILGFVYDYDVFYMGFIWNYVSLLIIWAILFTNIKHPWMTILSMSTVYFIVSNFFVWLFFGMYPLTANGLAACYTAGVPFYYNNLIGDLAYTVGLLGLLAFITTLNLRKV